MTDIRDTIRQSIQSLSAKSLCENAVEFLRTLGYSSERTIDLGSSKPEGFLEFVKQNAEDGVFNEQKALFDQWKSADLLFQLTDSELSTQKSLFEETNINAGLLRSYLFFAIELSGDDYSRGRLTDIARQINRVFPMPVMVLLKHKAAKQPVLSIAVINRRQNKRDSSRDVLGKVTIIRDIVIEDPHRGHLDILASFALETLREQSREPIETFDALHVAWEQIFNVELLNQRFYRELASWYFWALTQVEYPDDVEEDEVKRNATSLIRLLTRLIFCWFLKEKGLIPPSLFDEHALKELLVDLKSDSNTYHQGILQNLFFGTLNQQMGKNPKTKKSYREFAKDEGFKKNRSTYDVNNLYRYEALFHDADEAIKQFADIPFLNGGLFECLDRTDEKTGKKLYIDGFSRNKKKRPQVPNYLFFSEPIHGVDLSGPNAYGIRSRRNETVRGLIRILNAYKFTIVENTPIDQEIALDPELLGKVFENLLASYNEETKTTARKQTGSFYTPRPIVEYMVDESLKAHLRTALTSSGLSEDTARDGLESLFAYTEQPHPFDDDQIDTLLEAIHACKILDPACGSGAFPMGMLQKLVYVIHKLDPDNAKWMQLQIDKADEIPDSSARNAAVAAIEKDFRDNDDDYGRKLYLIENCLYGVDIQPIAIQISKLRFFISLICDQRTNRSKKDNHGIRPLPNLETKFVAADTLISLKKDAQLELFESKKIQKLEKELQRIRHDHFAATTRQKKQSLQKRDREIRAAMAKELEQSTFWDQDTALKLAGWDPYDPQGSASFFEPLWMFDKSLSDGFDLLVGNPPYISVERFAGTSVQNSWKDRYKTYAARGDIYCFFYERGAELLRDNGTLTYITSNKWMRAGYGKMLRKFLSNKVDTQAVLDFGMAQNFGAATTYTCITRFAANPSRQKVRSCYASDDRAAMADPARYFLANSVVQSSLSEDPWVVLSSKTQEIKSAVEAGGLKLKDWNIQINYGIKTGFNEAFYLSQEQRDEIVEEDPSSVDVIHRLIRGRDISRYRVSWPNAFQLAFPFGSYTTLQVDYPAVFRHLSAFEKQLRKRGQCQYSRASLRSAGEQEYPGQHHWLELDNNPTSDFLDVFSKPKILYQEIAQKLPFYFDLNEHYVVNDTCYVMTSDTECLESLVCVLNSSVFRCCFKNNFPENAGNTYRVKKSFFELIPIRRIESRYQDTFRALVHFVQHARRSGMESIATFLEDLIDGCVMESYFREHMAERDLLFLDDLVSELEDFDPSTSESKRSGYLDYFYRTHNAPEAPIRNRLLRISADSPDLLAVIKKEGRV
ncbi:Type IIS restriction enzyme Eco57I [Novipirellula galeiformis]|uniref:site-specific DNA-methyltransferase (adenine-specific) n=1 Tax=Novipirellula galeiformis TaxID=2528004 RepID=A0A5C6CK94_9BACT|nr:TaqI-like C-terminal specificity domain-containing protein [Novipirellula galeiformis]TWU23239.1 Type IIS restriction enzyme Eco57I [Novipirellula galeiformis]